LKKIKVEFSYDINHILASEELIDCSIAFNGEILILTLLTPPDFYEEKGHAAFPKVKSTMKNHYRVYFVSSTHIKCIDINNEKMNYHFIRDLGNRTFLLACSRSLFKSKDNYDLNAHVFDDEGNKLKEFIIGDGVQDIKITRKGVIWTSYFDEGVFGNYGWDEPIGAVGLRAWDLMGKPVYSYKPSSDEYFIVDCYALNVSDRSDIWFYFYTDFYIGLISMEEEISYWKPQIEGAQTLLVSDNYLLLDKGYQKRNEYQLFKIEENKMKSISTFKFYSNEGLVLETLYYFYGSKALFFNSNKLYIVDIGGIIG
jgi:hypothetical protein